MKFRATILAVSDVSAIKQLPDAYVSLIMLDPHDGALAKGDVLRFGDDQRDVLDVATNTDFFDEFIEGSIGAAVGGAQLDARELVGRTAYVMEG